MDDIVAEFLVESHENLDLLDRDALRQPVRDLCRFERSNLALPATNVPASDVVFLRNVLIYFDLDTKRAVLGHIRKGAPAGRGRRRPGQRGRTGGRTRRAPGRRRLGPVLARVPQPDVLEKQS